MGLSALVLTLMCLWNRHLIMVSGDINMDRLMNNLLKYNVKLAPPEISNITIDVGIALLDIEYDSTANILTVSAWENYSWKDCRLTWNESDYGGIRSVRIPYSHLWVPDITLYNAYGNSYWRALDKSAVLQSYGKITWVFPSVFKIRCQTKFSQNSKSAEVEADDDSITCLLKFGSWTYDGGEMPLHLSHDGIDLASFVPNNYVKLLIGRGEIEHTKYECCPEEYTAYVVTLKLKLRL